MTKLTARRKGFGNGVLPAESASPFQLRPNDLIELTSQNLLKDASRSLDLLTGTATAPTCRAMFVYYVATYLEHLARPAG